MAQSKVYISNNTARIKPPKATAPVTLTSLPAMTVGGWGDPHMYVNVPEVIGKTNRIVQRYIAKWGDNKSGSSGNTELKLIDLQTTTDTVKIYYTNKNYTNGAKLISSIRVELNGVSTSYTNTARVTAGPITVRILKNRTGANAYLDFEATWSAITNIVSFSGALSVILKRVAANRGVMWNGGDGVKWDGFGQAASVYGLSRASFETGIGGQSVGAGALDDTDQQKLADFIDLAPEESFDANMTNQGEDGDNTDVSIWDAECYADRLSVLSMSGGFEEYVNGIVDGGGYGQSITQNIKYIP